MWYRISIWIGTLTTKLEKARRSWAMNMAHEHVIEVLLPKSTVVPSSGNQCFYVDVGGTCVYLPSADFEGQTSWRMSTLICSRISSATSRCCRASFATKSLQSTAAVPVSFLPPSKVSRGGLHQFVSSPSSSSLSSTDVLRRFLASTASTPDFLRCWRCNEDFSHCVHSMVIILFFIFLGRLVLLLKINVIRFYR